MLLWHCKESFSYFRGKPSDETNENAHPNNLSKTAPTQIRLPTTYFGGEIK
jgi:hypothetical protein